MIRRAISPRLAIKMRLYIGEACGKLATCQARARRGEKGFDKRDACHQSHHLLVSTLNSGLSKSTDSPSSTSTATIVPLTSAGISLNVFIASTMQTVFSGETRSPTFANGSALGLGFE